MLSSVLFAAASVSDKACSNGGNCNLGLPSVAAGTSNLQSILQAVFAIFGVVAVLVIVIGAFQFINSEGDPSKARTARHTIIYAGIGLAVSVSAIAIVSFVLGQF
mgnify:CR=1 FL=1